MAEARRPPTTREPLGRLLAALTDPRCRQVVRHFHHADESTATLGDVAAAVAAMDPGADPEYLAVMLHHAALPKLSAVGVLTYDPASWRVEYGAETLDADARALLAEAATVDAVGRDSPLDS